MKYCIRCGKVLPEDTVFCTGCGAKATPATDAAAPSYAPPPMPAKSGITFRNTGLGFILPAVMLIFLFYMGLTDPLFSSVWHFKYVVRPAVPYILVAFAVVLSSRAKGPDLSLGAILGLSGIIVGLVMQSGGSWLAGLLLAIAAAAVVGAVNGVINGLIRVRSAVPTVLISAAVTWSMSFFVRRIAAVLSGGIAIRLSDVSLGAAGILVVLTAFAIAFALNLGTKLGTPVFRNSRSIALCIVSYILSAVIAALAGFFMLLWVRAASPTMGTDYGPFILFIFACLLSSRVLDNRYTPAIYVLPLGFIWVWSINFFMINSVNLFFQYCTYYALSAVALLIAFVSRFEKKRTIL